jgi:hypothetical protein
MMMRIARYGAIVLLLVALGIPAPAQTSVGPVISQVQNDFGFGAEIVSPRFLGDAFAVSATGKLNYLPAADWQAYGFGAVSLLAGITSPTPTSNLYGKAGLVAIVPSDEVAGYDVALGALGAFGFEFFFTEERRGSYYIELGGVGTGAEADARAGSPIYANGFLTNVGVRYYF